MDVFDQTSLCKHELSLRFGHISLVVERTAKGMRSEAQPDRCLRRVRESSHVFLRVFFTVGKVGT